MSASLLWDTASAATVCQTVYVLTSACCSNSEMIIGTATRHESTLHNSFIRPFLLSLFVCGDQKPHRWLSGWALSHCLALATGYLAFRLSADPQHGHTQLKEAFEVLAVVCKLMKTLMAEMKPAESKTNVIHPQRPWSNCYRMLWPSASQLRLNSYKRGSEQTNICLLMIPNWVQQQYALQHVAK